MPTLTYARDTDPRNVTWAQEIFSIGNIHSGYYFLGPQEQFLGVGIVRRDVNEALPLGAPAERAEVGVRPQRAHGARILAQAAVGQHREAERDEEVDVKPRVEAPALDVLQRERRQAGPKDASWPMHSGGIRL